MAEKQQIKCPVCGAVVVEDTNALKDVLVADDIRCSCCKSVVISVPKVMLSGGSISDVKLSFLPKEIKYGA